MRGKRSSAVWDWFHSSPSGAPKRRVGSALGQVPTSRAVYVIIGRYGRVVDDLPGSAERSSMVTFRDGNLHMDFAERMVIFDHRPASLRNRVILNPDESGVLRALVEHRGETVSAEQLGEMVWGEANQDVAKRTVKVVSATSNGAAPDGPDGVSDRNRARNRLPVPAAQSVSTPVCPRTPSVPKFAGDGQRVTQCAGLVPT